MPSTVSCSAPSVQLAPAVQLAPGGRPAEVRFGGLLFRGALSAARATARPEARAEVLAGYFLGAYVGLSVPAIGLGVGVEYIPTSAAMLVFVVLVSIAVIATVRAMTHGNVDDAPHETPDDRR